MTPRHWVIGDPDVSSKRTGFVFLGGNVGSRLSSNMVSYPGRTVSLFHVVTSKIFLFCFSVYAFRRFPVRHFRGLQWPFYKLTD
jgi:hypothetical protein